MLSRLSLVNERSHDQRTRAHGVEGAGSNRGLRLWLVAVVAGTTPETAAHQEAEERLAEAP